MSELIILGAALVIVAGLSCLGVIWYRSQLRVRDRLRWIDEAVQDGRKWSLESDQRIDWLVRVTQDISRKTDAVLAEIRSLEPQALQSPASNQDSRTRSQFSIAGARTATPSSVPLASSSPSAPGDTLSAKYNAAAIQNDDARTAFWDAYRPIRLAVSNAVERVKDVNEPPQFIERSDGEYLAIRLAATGSRYAVVPRFDLTPEETILGPGAMGQIFDCRGYDRRAKNTRFALLRPASFEKDGMGWSMREQGVLSFTP